MAGLAMNSTAAPRIDCSPSARGSQPCREDDLVRFDPDWVAAGGQVAGAVATFLAVVVALRIARRDRRQREQDRVDEAQGRAAMVFAKDDGGSVVVTNHSDRVVRDVAVRVGHPSEMPLHWSPSNPTGYVADLLPAGTTATMRSSYELVSASGDTRYPLNGAARELDRPALHRHRGPAVATRRERAARGADRPAGAVLARGGRPASAAVRARRAGPDGTVSGWVSA